MKDDSHQKKSAFDPPVSIINEGRQVHIRISLPGVAEEQIRIDLEKTTFTVSVSRNGTVERKFILVPEGARFFRKKFSDGILEIILEKPAV